MKDVIPNSVFAQIQSHVEAGCRWAEESWESASDDEDTLTGELGGALRTNWNPVFERNQERWKWRVYYNKFRGRGKNAPEKHLGADGIFQLEVEDARTGSRSAKGMLFQAKKITDRNRRRTVDQVSKME